MKRPFAIAILGALAAAPSAAPAQDVDTSRVSAEMRVGGIYTDNFYYDASTAPQTSGIGALIAPQLGYRGSIGRNDLVLGANGEIGVFDTPGSADNYFDSRLLADLTTTATTRTRLNLHAGWQRTHDPFGTNRTQDATVRDTNLDIWSQANGGGLYHFGALDAPINTELGFEVVDKSYLTNRGGTAFLDYRTVGGNATVFYNYSLKTAALLEVGRTGISFDQSSGGLERAGHENRLRTGGRWLATAKTSGEFRIGWYKRVFDNSSFSDSGFDWTAGIRWEPRARTSITFDTARAEQESYRADTFTNITRSATLGWREDWTSRTNTSLRLGEIHTEFLGLGRGDHLYNAGLGVNQVLSQNAALVFSLDIFNLNSNDPASEFKRFSSYLGIRFSG